MRIILPILIMTFLVAFTSFNAVTTVRGSMQDDLNIKRLKNLYYCREPKIDEQKPKVVLRIDNIQAYAWRDVSVQMSKDALKAGIPPVLGVIPDNLDQDENLTKYLSDERCRLEIAQQQSSDDLKAIGQGKNVLTAINEDQIKTFIPKDDKTSPALNKTLLANSFIYLSKKGDKDYLNVTAETYDQKAKMLLPVSTVIDDCKLSIERDNICVVSVHPQYFQSGSKTSQLYYDFYYLNLLDELKGLDVQFVRYKDFRNIEGIVADSKYSGWIADFDEGEALGSLEVAKDKIDTALPLWYQLTEEGVIKPTRLQSYGYDYTASNKALKITPSIINNFDPKRSSIFLADPKLQDVETDRLVQLALKKGYAGYDLDWEELSIADRDKFTEFVRTFAEKLHQNKLTISVSVHAKTGTDIDHYAAESQDWESLGQIVDQFRIMAYDYHATNTKPGPIAPKAQVEKVIQYAVKVIPKHKIILGLATYGYDWVDNKGTPLQYRDALNLVEKQEILADRDKDSGSLTVIYQTEDGKRHTLWFEDSFSASQKITIARKYGVYQFSFWRLGAEDEHLWD